MGVITIKKLIGIFLGLTGVIFFVSPVYAETLSSMIKYYTAPNPFTRSTTPFSGGVATQSVNSDGSVTVNLNNVAGYGDSGFVMYYGKLGDLNNFTLVGTGDEFGLNIWFDKDNDGEIFNWTGDVFTGVGNDGYILGPGSVGGVMNITDSSQFTSLIPSGGNYTLAQLKAGLAPGITSNTNIAFWVGDCCSGTKSTTINFPQPLKGKDVLKATGGIWMSNPNQQMRFNAFDQGLSMFDKGSVEYWNYEYPGGLHYTAPILCAKVVNNDARLMFQVPTGWPGLSGIYVVSSVHDGGTPGTKGDLYGHTATWNIAQAISWCEYGVGVANYPITEGNLVVHK